MKEMYDFTFSDWVYAVKGTRSEGHIHTINGFDQLKPPSGKYLALIPFLATKSNNSISKSLQDLIEDFEAKYFKNKSIPIE